MRGLLQNLNTYALNAMKNASELNENTDGASLPKKQRINYIHEVISDIASNKPPYEDLLNLASVLGKLQCENFKSNEAIGMR